MAVQWRPCEARPALEVAARKPQSKRAFPVGVSAVCQHWSMIPREVQGILFLLASLVPSWEDLIQLVLCSTDPVLGSSTTPGLGPLLLSWRVPAVSAEVPRLAQRQGLLWGTLLWPSAPLCAGIQDHCDPAGLQAGGGGPRHGGAAGPSPWQHWLAVHGCPGLSPCCGAGGRLSLQPPGTVSDNPGFAPGRAVSSLHGAPASARPCSSWGSKDSPARAGQGEGTGARWHPGAAQLPWCPVPCGLP